MLNGKELQKEENEIFRRLKLCRRIPIPFLVLGTEKVIAFSLVQKNGKLHLRLQGYRIYTPTRINR
jgi:hypothetical protein